MSLKKFGQSDVIKNVMRAYPHNNFRIYSSSVYYDNRPIESGSLNDDILSASGGLSLFEYNVDRSGSTHFTDFTDEDGNTSRTQLVTSDYLNPPIIPYVTKGSSKVYLKASSRVRTITEGADGTNTILVDGMMQDVSDDYSREPDGSVLTGSSYVMSASITRELMTNAGEINAFLTDAGRRVSETAPVLVAAVRDARIFNASGHQYDQVHQLLRKELSDKPHTGVVQSTEGQPFQARLSLEERLCCHRSPIFLGATQWSQRTSQSSVSIILSYPTKCGTYRRLSMSSDPSGSSFSRSLGTSFLVSPWIMKQLI